MKQLYIRTINFTVLFVLLPILYGCKGDGGAESFATGGYLSPPPGDGGTIPITHQPEPATMLLLGGGLAAMAYLSRRKSKR